MGIIIIMEFNFWSMRISTVSEIASTLSIFWRIVELINKCFPKHLHGTSKKKTKYTEQEGKDYVRCAWKIRIWKEFAEDKIKNRILHSLA